MKYRDYIRREVESFSDRLIIEAMEYKRTDTSGMPAYIVGTKADTVKSIISTAACIVLAVVVVIAVILMRNSITPQPADTTDDTTETEESLYKASNDEYEYIVEDGEVTIIRYLGDAEEITLPEEIDGKRVVATEYWTDKRSQELGIVYGTNVKSVKIPGSIERIGEYSFAECEALVSVTFSEGLKEIKNGVFLGCTALESVTIPDGVKKIGHSAFSGCTALQSIELPSSVTEIEFDAFSSCTALQSIELPENLTAIEDFTFTYCTSLKSVTIPDSVKKIGEDAFCECTSLEKITIPSSVESMEGGTFAYCTALSEVVIEEGIKSIGDHTFYGCSSLVSVSLPESLVSLDGGAFWECDTLQTVYYSGSKDEWHALMNTSSNTAALEKATVIFESDSEDTGDTEDTEEPIDPDPPTPSEVRLTEDGLYEYFINGDGGVTIVKYFGGEKEVIVPETIEDIDVTVIGEGAFLGCDMEIVRMPMLGTIEKSAFEDCNNLKGVYISGIGFINERAFYGCEKLTEVELGYFLGCRFIGDYAFYECDLRSISFPLTIYSIGDYAFAENYNLEKIEFPDSLATSGNNNTLSLGKYAFSCTAISSVTIYSYITSISEGAFANNRNLKTLYIRNGVKTIGTYAFGNCSSLAEVLIANSISEISENSFDGCLSLTYVTYDGTEAKWKSLSGSEALGNAQVDCIGSAGVMIRQEEAIETVDLAAVLEKHGIGGYTSIQSVRKSNHVRSDEILTDADGGLVFDLSNYNVSKYTTVKLYPGSWNVTDLQLLPGEDHEEYVKKLRRENNNLETPEYSIYLGGPAGNSGIYDSPEDAYIYYKDSGEIFKIYDLYTMEEADIESEAGTPLPEIPVSIDEAAVWNGRLLIGQVCAGNYEMGVILFDLETKKTHYFHYYEFGGLTGDTLHIVSNIEETSQVPDELSFEPVDISPYLDAYKGLTVNYMDRVVRYAYYNGPSAFNEDGTLFAYIDRSRDGNLGYNVLTVVDIESGKTEKYTILEYCTWDYTTGINDLCFTENGDILLIGAWMQFLAYIVHR